MKHARKVASPHVVNINDLRTLARRKVPRVVFDYLDGGAEDEITLRENRRAFEEITFRPRQAVAIPHCDLRTRVLGFDLSLPFLLAPVGYSRVINASGEVAAARMAGQAGTAYILSTISGYPLEEVKAASTAPVFYQLYILAGREAAEGGLERARKAGFAGLFVTVDTAVGGMRERDFRNGMKELLGPSLIDKIRYSPQVLARPGWLASFLLDGGVRPLPNVVVPGRGPMPLIDVGAALAQSTIAWEDLRWIHDAWRGPVFIKGVLTGDDARRAIDEGATAVVVSNHGGRQLDGVQATLRATARNNRRGRRPNRSPNGRGHSSRRRHRKSALSGRPCSSLRQSLRLRLGGGRRSRRSARHRNPARGFRAHAEIARLPVDRSARALLHFLPAGLTTDGRCASNARYGRTQLAAHNFASHSHSRRSRCASA